MNKNIIIAVIAVTLLMIGAGIVFASRSQKPPVTGLDDFAKCLASKNVTMYGAAWCPHCQNEKKAFGDSFKYVPYVECPAEPQKCLDKGVNGYPTWITGDGTKHEGEQGLKNISQFSGCTLPL